MSIVSHQTSDHDHTSCGRSKTADGQGSHARPCDENINGGFYRIICWNSEVLNAWKKLGRRHVCAMFTPLETSSCKREDIKKNRQRTRWIVCGCVHEERPN